MVQQGILVSSMLTLSVRGYSQSCLNGIWLDVFWMYSVQF